MIKNFTNAEKLTAVRRELELRKRVYKRQVEQGKMNPQESDYQIRIFEAIEADYAARIHSAAEFA